MKYAPIISPNCRIRHPDAFHVGEGSIVDDYSYFSTRVEIGRFSHIAASCTIGGGRDRLFRLGDFSSVSSGVRIWCTSDNFAEDLVTIIPADIPNPKENLISGDVICGDMTAIGANSVIMPNNQIPEGVAVGALSYVPPAYAFEAWMVYAGVPIRPLRARNREAVERQRARLLQSLGGGAS